MARSKVPTNDDPGTTAASPGLDSLVEGTAGLQPGRRIFHATNGTLIALALTWLDLSRDAALQILGAVLVLLVLLDGIRLRVPRANEAFFRAFRDLASPREATGPASSTWYALGVLLALALFSREAAVSGVLVLAYADPAASYGGRRWGKRPFLGGSLEGSAIFVMVAFGALAARHSLLVATVAAATVALAERLSWPLDDNLTVPVVGAGMVTLLEALA